MATVEGFQSQNINGLLRPEAPNKEGRESERLDQLQKSAEDNLHHFDRFLGIGSGAENLNRIGLARQIRNRVFDVLEDASDRYGDTVQRAPGEFSQVESYVWNQRQGHTLASIQNRGRGARRASQQVAEGFEPIMEKAIEGFNEQLSVAESAAEARLDARSRWGKLWGLRQKKRLAKFTAKCRASIEREQSRLSAALNVIKQTKEVDVKRAENRIQMAYSNANDTQKTFLWSRIHDAIQDPTRNARNAARLFGYRDVSDFMEAVHRLDFIDGAIKTRESQQHGVDAQETLSRLSHRERRMTIATPHYDVIQARLDAMGLSPSEKEDITTNDIADSIEKDLIGQGVNLLESVYRGNRVENASGAEKLMFFTQFLTANPAHLIQMNPEIQRDFLKYLNDFDKKSEGNYIDFTPLKEQSKNLEEVVNEANRITNTPPRNLRKFSTLQNIKKNGTPSLSASIFQDILANAENWCNMFSRQKQLFEGQKEKLDDEHRTEFEKRWATIQRLFDKLQPQIEKWKQERKEWDEWRDEQNAYNKKREKLTKHLKKAKSILIAAESLYKKKLPSKLSANQKSKERQSRLEAVNQRLADVTNIKTARNNLSEPSNTPPEFTHPSDFVAVFREMEEVFTEFNTNATPWNADLVRIAPGPSPATFNQRMQENLKNEFQEHAEKDYLKFLQENTESQWNLLNDIPTGATVHLDFRDTTNVSTLQFPRDLDRRRETRHSLRVIQKNESGIMLEDRENIYVLTGPSASNGVAKTNVAQYRKVDSAGRDINRPLNANTDFSIPENNPNSVGIALNMSIAA